MWFKSLNVYQLGGAVPSEDDLEKLLIENAFHEEGPKPQLKRGFVPPVPMHDRLVHTIQGCHLVCIKEEVRKVPADILKEEMAKEIKKRKDRGEEVNAKAKREIKEEIASTLYPKVMPKVKRTWAYLDAMKNWLVIDEASRKKGEDWAGFVRKSINVPMIPIQSNELPGRKMKMWMATNSFPNQISPGAKCKLFMLGETKDVVNYTGHELSLDGSIQTYLDQGYEVSEMEVRQQITGDATSYTLTEDLLVKGVTYSQYILADVGDQSQDEASNIEATFVAVFGTAREIYDKLLSVLGGKEEKGEDN